MPQGYRAKDHVVIKTYSGSSRPQSVFDWVSVNLASRVHHIHDLDRLHRDWYQFQRKAEKASSLLLSQLLVFAGRKEGNDSNPLHIILLC